MRNHSDAILLVSSDRSHTFTCPVWSLVENTVVESNFCLAHQLIFWGVTFKCQDVK